MSHVHGQKRKKLHLVLLREREKIALFPEAAWRSAESGFTCSFPATHMQTFDSQRNYTTRIASTCKPFHLHFLSAEKSKTLFIVPGLQKGRKKDSYKFRGMEVKNIYMFWPLFFTSSLLLSRKGIAGCVTIWLTDPSAHMDLFGGARP